MSQLLDSIRAKVNTKHYSRKTADIYVSWAKRFILYHHKRHPRDMGLDEIKVYLSYLANDCKIAATTQNQCLHALQFLYGEVLEIKVDGIYDLRAKEGERLPIVLNREDTARVLGEVQGEPFPLMAQLLYGAGLRLKECLQLRFKDIEFSTCIITVRGGKGDKDRTVPLPRKLIKPLMDQMGIARKLWEIDRQRGMPGVYVPNALDRKYPNIGSELGWFWIFPSPAYSTDPETRIYRRHHQYESGLQKAIRAAAKRAGVYQHVTPHTFRHCFATHLLWAGYDIRTVQELMGHKSVKTTMIYLHVVNPGGWQNVESPLDKMSTERLIRS